jgi:hypothetical protein
MATNKQVAAAFARGLTETAGHFRSTGDEVYSYGQKIAQRRPDGVVEVLSSACSPSQTTSRHMSLTYCAARALRVDEFTPAAGSEPEPEPPSFAPGPRESLDVDPAIWSV